MDNKLEKEMPVRHYFDEQMGEVYYSLVDIIDNLDLSTDPRNYWKVLKSRLKKGHNELVTGCNLKKMESSDGKYYKTDVANHNTILKIIEIIKPEKIKTFAEYFDSMNDKYKNEKQIIKKISTDFNSEAEIAVDMFSKNNFIFIKAMIGGTAPEKIFISLSYDKLIIRGNRFKPEDVGSDDYLIKELFWGKFEKEIELPHIVDIDRVEANLDYGLLTIKLSVLDRDRVKIVKVGK